MKKYTLSNGLTIIEENKKTDSVTIQVTVKVGSNNETDGIRGISHFIEHMMFEGTKKRKDSKIISNEIESLGGELNAYTDNTRTCYYIKVPKKHFDKAAEILSDMLLNSVFASPIIEKERKVILKEINIFNDESRYYQWILFESNLFKNHPSKYPAYGTREDVSKITRKDIIDYCNSYYLANNSILSIVGNVKSSTKIIKKYFESFRKGIVPSLSKVTEPKNSYKIVKEKRKLMNSYMVLGYKTVPRDHSDSYVLDVISSILGRGQSGKLFDEIRGKRGLAYEVGVNHDASTDYGLFAVYLSADKSKIPLVKKIIMQEFSNLGSISDKELKEAKGYLEGKHILDNEDTHNTADSLAFWELIKDAKLEDTYLKNINKVTKEDIRRVAKKYLNKDYTLAMVEQN